MSIYKMGIHREINILNRVICCVLFDPMNIGRWRSRLCRLAPVAPIHIRSIRIIPC